MTLQSWKNEFYPIEADTVAEVDAIAHSLQKWIGLLIENLEKHKCFIRGGDVSEGIGHPLFPISDDTCALCCLYFNPAQDQHVDCPLYDVREANCDGPITDEGMSPWHLWICTYDPRPMIALLQKALERQKQQEEELA